MKNVHVQCKTREPRIFGIPEAIAVCVGMAIFIPTCIFVAMLLR